MSWTKEKVNVNVTELVEVRHYGETILIRENRRIRRKL
jgi:hypothetical protein